MEPSCAFSELVWGQYVTLESRCFCANYLLRPGNRIRVFHETRLSHKWYFISSLAKLFSDPLLLRLEFST